MRFFEKEKNCFLYTLFFLNIILIICGILISLILFFCLKKPSFFYSSIIFIPFGFLWIFIHYLTSFLINKKNNVFLFIFLSILKYLIIVLPLLICLLINDIGKQKNFDILFMTIEIIIFCLLIIITSFINERERKEIIKNNEENKI
ncbi:MAG: hypothetical protein LBF02_02695 [Mycoplasmataceae bacterium]|nr:hypothetical protein [Mycoplasmataceae bacterium]